METELIPVGPNTTSLDRDHKIELVFRECVARKPGTPPLEPPSSSGHHARVHLRAIDDETDPDAASTPYADAVERQLEHGSGLVRDPLARHRKDGSRASRPDPAGVGQPPPRPKSSETLERLESRPSADT
jgi:hypothetical protein